MMARVGLGTPSPDKIGYSALLCHLQSKISGPGQLSSAMPLIQPDYAFGV
jgi:hypothetical protein